METNRFPHNVNPVHVGTYKVENYPPVHGNSNAKIIGRFRYWDGERWLTTEPGHPWSKPSIFGTHPTHKWRGLASPAVPA